MTKRRPRRNSRERSNLDLRCFTCSQKSDSEARTSVKDLERGKQEKKLHAFHNFQSTLAFSISSLPLAKHSLSLFSPWPRQTLLCFHIALRWWGTHALRTGNKVESLLLCKAASRRHEPRSRGCFELRYRTRRHLKPYLLHLSLSLSFSSSFLLTFWEHGTMFHKAWDPIHILFTNHETLECGQTPGRSQLSRGRFRPGMGRMFGKLE